MKKNIKAWTIVIGSIIVLALSVYVFTNVFPLSFLTEETGYVHYGGEGVLTQELNSECSTTGYTDGQEHCINDYFEWVRPIFGTTYDAGGCFGSRGIGSVQKTNTLINIPTINVPCYYPVSVKILADFTPDGLSILSGYNNGWNHGQYPFYLYIKEDIYSKDLIIKVKNFSFSQSHDQYGYHCDSSDIALRINDEEISIVSLVSLGGCCSSGASCYSPLSLMRDFDIKILSNDENPKQIKLYINSVFIKDITLLSDSMKVGIVTYNGNPILLNNILIRRPCTGKFLVDEVFRGPQIISLDSLRYDNVKFCPQIYSMKLSNNQYIIQPEINTILSQGGLYQIKEGESVKMQYFIDAVGQFPIECTEENSDVFNYCYNASGFVHICSEGVYDTTLGTCAINANAPDYCKSEVEGVRIYGRYDIASKQCYYNNPQGDVCIKGTYSPIKGVCTWEPDCDRFEFNPVKGECCGSELQSFNPITGMCEEFTTEPVPENNQTINNTIIIVPDKKSNTGYIISGLVIAGLGGLAYWKRKSIKRMFK